MHKVVMPRIDPGMQTGFIVQWLKKEGDHVEKGEPVAIGEGEKTTFEIVAPEPGILRKTLYTPQSEVQVTETIAFVGNADEEIPIETSPTSNKQTHPSGHATSLFPASAVETPQPVSPAARRLAREHNVDLSMVRGTGPGGRITRDDVLKAATETVPSGQTASAGSSHPRVREESRLSATRKTIGERLTYSQQNTASTSIMMDVAMDALLRLKEQLDASNRQASISAMIVKSLAQALFEEPTFNSSLEEELLRTYSDINVAVAIQTPDGLVAPVVPHANEKSLEKITEEIKLLSAKAEARKLSISELTGSTITVSNLGPYEVDAFVPIINPPNAAILGVGRMSERPIVVNDKILPASIATFTLVFDHRIGDGAAAAKLLARVRELLEKPETLAQ